MTRNSSIDLGRCPCNVLTFRRELTCLGLKRRRQSHGDLLLLVGISFLFFFCLFFFILKRALSCWTGRFVWVWSTTHRFVAIWDWFHVFLYNKLFALWLGKGKHINNEWMEFLQCHERKSIRKLPQTTRANVPSDQRAKKINASLATELQKAQMQQCIPHRRGLPNSLDSL